MRRRPNWLSPVRILCGCLLLGCIAPVIAAPEDDPQEPAAEEPAEEEATEFNCALFLKRPRKLTKEMLVQAAAKAWEMEEGDAGKLKISVTAKAGTIRYQGVTFEVKSEATPWLEDQTQIIKETTDRQMRAMLRRVTSHLSITIQNKFKDDDDLGLAQENQVRLLGALVDPADTLAIYDDDTGDFNYIDDEVMEAIAGEDPHSAFDISVAPPPEKLAVESPVHQAAVAEAKRRWPEFAKAFRDFGEERGPYLVKASFGEGQKQELLWCELISLRPGKIIAVLKHDPTYLPDLAKGEQVEFPLSQLTDWTYPSEEGDIMGAFTVDLPAQ